MSEREVQNLCELLNEALRQEELGLALKLCTELEALEPKEPRWAQRKGDLLVGLDRTADAVKSFERAVDLYAAEGFLTRAIALAKVIIGFDPSRTDVIERLDPETARELHRRHRRIAQTRTAQAPGRTSKLGPGHYSSLARADDAKSDEVRFEDVPSIEIEVMPVEVGERTSYPELTFESVSEDDLDLMDEPEASAPTADQLAQLPAFPVFAELPREAFAKLASQAELVEVGGAEVIVRTGDLADSLYAIVDGAVRVDIPGTDQPVYLGEGDVFGESCLIEGATRKADVSAVGDLVALRIAEEVVEALVEAHPAVGDVMFDLLIRRVVGNLMVTSPLFSGFDPSTRAEIAKLFEARHAEDGQLIIERGKRSDGLYVLLAGTLELDTTEGAELIEPITMLGQGSLLGGEPASHSLRCIGEALLLRLPAGRFMQLAAVYPTVLAQLSELASLPPSVQLG